MLSSQMEHIMESFKDSYIREAFTNGGGHIVDGVDGNNFVYDGTNGMFYSVSINNETRDSKHSDCFKVQAIPVEAISTLTATMDRHQVAKFIKVLDDNGLFKDSEHKQSFIESLKSVDEKLEVL